MATLIELAATKGIRVAELARRTGLGTSTIYRMNEKDSRVTTATIALVCKELGITPEQYAQLDKGGNH